MKITEISVRRPAATIMVTILLLGLGILGYMKMGADLLPSVDFPIVAVITSYNGAGAEEIKKDIVKPIEDAVSGISGLDKITSTSNEGLGQVIIQFTSETDTDSAFVDVQKAIETIAAKLPKDAQKPVLYKFDPSLMPVLTLSVTGTASYQELYNEADKIKEEVQKINGIGKVTITGGQEKQLFIKIDKTALEYYGINLNTVMNKIRMDNANMPAGQIKQEQSNKSVKIIGEFGNINEVKNLLIPMPGGGNIRLSELAQIGLEYPEKEQMLRMDGQNSIGISIQKQSDANVVDAVNRVKKELNELEKKIPKGVKVEIADDTTTFIKTSLSGIKQNVVEGIITTAIVLLLFLQSWRSSVIVLVAIPTSLISTFFMMYMQGFTLNMMSLMALSLCIGILVDDSIVILENIQRHMGMGRTPIDAAIEGRSEIGMAAIAITLCDVVVFAPIAFMSGVTGQFFKEFGLTVVFASLFSLLVSFTITPMLCSRILKREMKSNEKSKSKKGSSKLSKVYEEVQKVFASVSHGYGKFLLWAMEHRWKIVIMVTAGFILSIALIPFGLISMEYMPQTDQSRFTIDMKLTPGSTLKQTDEKVRKVEAYLKSIPEVRNYSSTIGKDNDKASANIIVKIVEKSNRKRSQSDIAESVRNWSKNIDGVEFSVSESQMGGPSSSKPIEVNIKGADMAVLKEISEKVEKIVRSVPGTVDVSNSSKTRESEIQIRIDRLAATDYGVSTSDISTVLRTAIQGSNVGVFRENGDDHDIMVKFKDNQVKTQQDIGSIKIPNSMGQQISLNQVASINEMDSQQSISRIARQDVVKVTANMQTGTVLGNITGEITKKMALLSLPTGYTASMGGSAEDMTETFTSLLLALGASIALIYMILTVLYESFLTPALRMLSLPCAIIGALLMLALTGKSLNMMSMIGLIMLDGLASKNGTLLIDYTNTLMKEGMSLKEALIKSGTTRLRPIIMTSLTMIVGMMPAALSLGEGAEMKSSMGLIIIGGMISSTILTPILIPVAYTIIEDIRNKTSKRKNKDLTIAEVQ